MRIGFFDNLANNAYGLAKIFRKKGYEPDLIVDGADTFPMSQPIWEDCDFTIGTDQFEKRRLPPQYWEEKAREFGWKRPKWIIETKRKRKAELLSRMVSHPYRYHRQIATTLRHRSLFPSSFDSIREVMRQYDVIVGFGLGPIYAFSTKVPFIHYPYGGDLTLIPFQRNRVASFQRTALRHAKYVIVGDPNYFDYLKKLGIESKGEFIPFMIDTDVYKPLPKHQAIESMESDLRNRIANRVVFFVPSRQDFFWKSSNKMLMAFGKLVQKRKDVFMILSGWGRDLGKSKDMVDRLNLREHTFFLSHILSKKRLRRFYGFVDGVIDQFNLGAYGTSTLEALACGKPVIIDLDTTKYTPHLKELPPVLRAKSVEEIYRAMLKLSENKGNLCEQIGKESRDWIMEFHGVKTNFDRLIRLCRDSVTGPM